MITIGGHDYLSLKRRFKNDLPCFFPQEGKFGIAIQQYVRVVRLLDGYFSNDEKEKRDPLMLAGHLNLAACHLKLHNNFKCIKECEKVK